MTHHVCIYEDYTIFDDETIPIGKKLIEEKLTEVIGEILDSIVPHIGAKEEVVICGEGDARRILGRKLEDRLKREITYE
jgi:bisphosphoglycerate-dependent phosphoglycerate mutase